MQGWILHIYPFIYDFPKFLAEALIKVEDGFSRSFLIENIRIEKAHAEHWLWMGDGFCKRPLGVHALHPAGHRLPVAHRACTARLWFQHLTTHHFAALIHPSPSTTSSLLHAHMDCR